MMTYILTVKLTLLLIGANCNDIIGCGGFVKTDIKEFLYTKLLAQLSFLDGSINYVTEILPNGAYSVPIYDFGIYIIKIVGPDGWSFEPSNGYQLVINNHETCVDDYNFLFTGFSIKGKISTANIDQGPPGIIIKLVNNSKIIAQTSTIDGGHFIINKVIPGNYSLHFESETADGKSLEFNDTTFNFEIKNDNFFIKDSFIIYGYPVFGDVKIFNEPLKNVEFFVYSQSITIQNFDFNKYRCLRLDDNDLSKSTYNALCKTISNDKGEFLFPLLPGGHYKIIPIYKSYQSIYDIRPREYEFDITSNSVDLRSVFEVEGFSVNGRVMTLDGMLISEAAIFVDGKLLVKSDSNGNFTIMSVKRGIHEISIRLNGYLFNKTIVNFDPKNTVLGTFYPEKLGICGTIVLGNTELVEKEKKMHTSHKILLINESNGEILDFTYTQIQDVSSDDYNSQISSFCFYAKPGIYIVKPVVDKFHVSISLAPTKIKVFLKSEPIVIKFSPFRGSISGVVKCIENCHMEEFEVTLTSKDGLKTIVKLTQHISVSKEFMNQGHFLFKDVIPGNYHIELISANSHIELENGRWCWSRTFVMIDIMDTDVKNIFFEQIGFALPIYSTQTVKLDYSRLGEEYEVFGSKNIIKGASKICLPKSGKYEIRISSCHKLYKNSHVIDLNELCKNNYDLNHPMCQIRIEVKEFKSKVTFEVLDKNKKILNELDSDVFALLKINSNSITKKIHWNETKGYLEFWIKPESFVQLFVNSTKYLIKPEMIDIYLPNDTFECTTNLGSFVLVAGTFINGRVLPPLRGVMVEVRKKVASLSENEIEPIIASLESNVNGEFGIGPLNSSFNYELKLFKSGYKIIPDINVNNKYQFSAFKLAELIVKVVDNETEKSISGILLSIIGDDLRKNELTNEDGEYTFVDLSPGIYYLRPMMKELEFIPNGAIEIEIKEGVVQEILIKAVRTSFSLHGRVISLNGDSEAGLIVEGCLINDLINSDYQVNCKTRHIRNEYAKTDETGTFRIRGLLPECNYKIILKKVIGNENIKIRSYPNSLHLKMSNKDVHNVKIYALSSVNFQEIFAMVRTNQDYFQDSLQLIVFPTDNPDNILATHKCNSEGIYFQMNIPISYKSVEYVIRLQSNLNPSIFNNISAQEKIFRIEFGDIKSFSKYFEFHFYPIKKSLSDSDIAMTLTSSLLIPILIIFILMFLYKKESLEPTIFTCFKWIKSYLLSIKYQGSHSISNSSTKSNIFDAIDISELNNVVAKPNSISVLQPIKKVPFWSKPKKV